MSETGQPPPQEATKPTVEAQKAERSRVVQRVVAAKAAEGREKVPTTRADQALREYDKIATFKDGQTIKYAKATADGDKDLLLPGFDTIDDQGQPVAFRTGEWRVAQVGVKGGGSISEDGEIVCIIENDKGETVQAPIPQEWILDGQLKAQEKDFEDAFTEDPTAQKFIKDHIASLPQSGDNPPDGEFPDAATIKALEAQYAAPTPMDTELQQMANEKTPVQQVDAILNDQIAKLEEKGKTEKLNDDDLKLLGSFRLALSTNGEVGIAFKVDALQVLKGMGVDVEAQITAVMPDVSKAQDVLTQMILDAGIKPEQFDKWLDLAKDPGGMLQLLQDKEFSKFITQKEAEISKAIFGKEMNRGDLKDLLKDTKLPPELEKALEDADGTSLWKILLMIAGGIIVGIPVAAVTVPTFAASAAVVSGATSVLGK